MNPRIKIAALAMLEAAGDAWQSVYPYPPNGCIDGKTVIDGWVQPIKMAEAVLNAVLGDEFVVVPKEPTEEMLNAEYEKFQTNPFDERAALYKAMIAAYPSNEDKT